MEAELMPVVSAADLKAVYDFFRPDRLRCSGGGAFTVVYPATFRGVRPLLDFAG